MEVSKNEQYASEIYNFLLDGFTGEEEVWDINRIDATEWFTGLIKASGMLFNRLTESEKNFIEWTHIQQQLLIQDMMERHKAS